jgi:hypothetical protein
MGMSPPEPLLPCAFLVASSLSKKEKEERKGKEGRGREEGLQALCQGLNSKESVIFSDIVRCSELLQTVPDPEDARV